MSMGLLLCIGYQVMPTTGAGRTESPNCGRSWAVLTAFARWVGPFVCGTGARLCLCGTDQLFDMGTTSMVVQFLGTRTNTFNCTCREHRACLSNNASRAALKQCGPHSAAACSKVRPTPPEPTKSPPKAHQAGSSMTRTAPASFAFFILKLSRVISFIDQRDALRLIVGGPPSIFQRHQLHPNVGSRPRRSRLPWSQRLAIVSANCRCALDVF